jgi:hypothetical protein
MKEDRDPPAEIFMNADQDSDCTLAEYGDIVDEGDPEYSDTFAGGKKRKHDD